MIACAVGRKSVVVNLVEPLAGENLRSPVSKVDGNGNADRKVPFHSDEALGVLLEGDHEPTALSIVVDPVFRI